MGFDINIKDFEKCEKQMYKQEIFFLRLIYWRDGDGIEREGDRQGRGVVEDWERLEVMLRDKEMEMCKLFYSVI